MDLQQPLSQPDKISDALDIAPLVVEEVPVEEVIIEDDRNRIEQDYEFARQNLRGMLEKGHKALETLMQVADSAQTARSYEVMSELLTTLANANKDLLELARRKEDLKPTPAQRTSITNNNLFLGSTAELLKLVKEAKKVNE